MDLLDGGPDAAYLMDAGLALSQRQHWENAFHAELITAYASDPTMTLTASALMPSWLSQKAERALLRLTYALPSWAGEFIRNHAFPDPANMAAEAGVAPPVTPTQVADALAPTLATAAFAQHTLLMLAQNQMPYKRWVTRHDDKVRASHREADAQVVPLSSPFVVGGALMQYPADARTAPIGEWINDRCVIIGADGP